MIYRGKMVRNPRYRQHMLLHEKVNFHTGLDKNKNWFSTKNTNVSCL